MRIAVIGAGAIGSAVAAALAENGQDVVLLARGRRLAALQAGGLRLLRNGRVRHVDVPACAAEELGQSCIDLVICCVKTTDLQVALLGLETALAPEPVVLTLQNGVESHERAAAILPAAAIVAGRMHGFFELDDDVVRHVGVPPSILLGSAVGNVAAEHTVAEVFAGSGIATDISSDITQALWEKFLLAASIGSVGAALGTPAGRILASPKGEVLLRGAMAEIVALARSRGVGLDDGHIAQTLAFVGSFPAGATTSLQRDLEAGRPTEFDALTGAVLRLAKADATGALKLPLWTDLYHQIIDKYELAPSAAS